MRHPKFTPSKEMNVPQSPHRHPLRRIVVGTIATAATVIALAGCSTAGGSDDGTTEITLSMQNPDVETADPATWAIVEAFEEANPDIDVTVSGEAVSEHLQKLSIAAQSDTLPDIFWVYKSTAEEMQAAGKLLDLAPVLDELGLTDAFPESTVANFSKGDVIYGVP
jgi:raffinose/stachyose/melibiose transport system substrate-binding protein